MRKANLICFALLAAGHISLPAQMHSVTQRSVTTNAGDRRDEIYNGGDNPIVAFDARYKCRGLIALTYTFDTALNYGTNSPVGSGRSFQFDVPRSVANCEGGVDAVVFSDGHTEGDSKVVQEIAEKRRGALDELTKIIDLIEADRADYSADLLAGQLYAKIDQISSEKTLSAAERKGRMYMLDTVGGLLKRRHVIDTPSDHTVQRGPSVTAVMSRNGTDREKAHAIVLKRKLQEWATDLGAAVASTAN